MNKCPITDDFTCPDGVKATRCTVCDNHSSKRLARIITIYLVLVAAAIIALIILW